MARPSGAGAVVAWNRIALQTTAQASFNPPRESRSIAIVQAAVLDANLGTTSIYLQGIDPEEILAAVRARRAPMMSANAGLRF